MTQLSKFGSNDLEMIDRFHGGEVCYIKMLIIMVKNGSILKNYTNIDKLKYQLSKKIIIIKYLMNKGFYNVMMKERMLLQFIYLSFK